MLFDKILHKYVITDAIRDENVLKFSIEYILTFKKKEHIIDINVEAIDEAEVMNAPERLNNIIDYIINNHNRKTHSREFTSIFAVSRIDTLIEYYKLFHQKKEEGLHNLRLATMFSYQANENDKDAIGFVPDDDFLIAADPQAQYGMLETHDRTSQLSRSFHWSLQQAVQHQLHHQKQPEFL